MVILLAEDYKEMRDAIKSFLLGFFFGAKTKIEVIEAANGELALEIIQMRPDINLVITDNQMPNMTGVELTDRIKSGPLPLPVILLSMIKEPAGHRADVFVRKTDFSSLSMAIRKLCKM